MANKSPASSGPPKNYSNKEVGVGLAVGVAVPIIIIMITITVILLLLLAFFYYRSHQKKKETEDRGTYMPLPKEDSGTARIAPLTPKLPYPPSVMLSDPPIPRMTFTMATQLSDSVTRESRYPFMTTDASPDRRQTKEEKRPHRQRHKRRGNEKQHVGQHLVSSADQSSDVSDHSSDGKGVGSVDTGDVVPKVYSLSAEKTSEMGPVVSGGATPLPEIFFVLVYNESISSLIVKIERVVSLPLREDGVPVDAYVRLFLLSNLADVSQRRTSKTRTQRRDSAPVFEEDIFYEGMSNEELLKSTLHIEVMDYQSYGKHITLGEVSLPLAEVTFESGEAAVRLQLHIPEVKQSLGTVLLSLCYSPESKKLSIIILRAKDLNNGKSKETDVQARLWVSATGDKILGRLRTKRKNQSCSPIFNEALSCTVEPNKISTVTVNVAITNECKASANRSLGQVAISAQLTGEEFRHWNDVMATPGKHISEWHELR